jgi:hypothetical protein
MKLKFLPVWSALALLVVSIACQKSSPSRPSDVAAAPPSGAVVDAKTGITLTTPQLVTPTAGQRFRFAEQPLTLTVKNAASTGSAALTYGFQVASDSAFANVVFSKDGVAEGGGQTSLKVDRLAGAKDYFWRARASSGAVGGPYAAGRTFNVGPEVVLQAPVLTAPANSGTANGSNPTLSVNNVDRTGPAGQVFYRFEVSDSPGFASLVFVNTVAEQAGDQTSAQVAGQLVSNATYYWRVQATDPSNAVNSPFSAVFSFRYVPFDMRQAAIYDSPPDLGFWNETAKITRVDFTVEAFLVDFDRRNGPDRWRDLDFGDGRGGTLQYTLGMCLNINSRWNCSAVVQFWFGRELTASTPPSYVGRNWFYDARWGPMQGHQPENGEQVGLFVGTGNLRGKSHTGGSCPQICERSNVAIVPWHNDDPATFTFFSAGLRTLGFRK